MTQMPTRRILRRRCWRRPELILLLLAAAPAGGETLYARGTTSWLARHYPPAVTDLVAWRALPGGRTADVDYKIGTSGCRIDDQRTRGAQYLAYALKRYPLTPESSKIIIDELQRCLSNAAMPVLSAASAATVVAATAGATAQGKMFYSVNATEAVAAYPARPIGTPDRAKFAARVTKLGHDAAVTAKVRVLVPDGVKVAVRGRFVFASTSQSDAQLTEIAAQLEEYLQFLHREYGVLVPDHYLTVYFVNSVGNLRSAARSLHQLDVSPATIGYTFQDDQSAVVVIPGTQIGTLLHELFHMVVRTNFGDIPQWLDEGIASLYEVSTIGATRVTGTPNWRGPVLEQFWSIRPSLADLVGAPWLVSDSTDFSAPDARPERTPGAIAVQFAAARYFALYLQDKQQLREVFNAMQALRPEDGDPTTAERKTVERITGPLATLQANWETWFRNTGGRPANPPTGTPVIKYEPRPSMPMNAAPPAANQRAPTPNQPASANQPAEPELMLPNQQQAPANQQLQQQLLPPKQP